MDRRIKVMENFLAKRVDEGTARTNCFTDGKKIWSYGRHFEMAEWTGVSGEDGREIMLVNEERYSVTTSKMQRELQSVLRHGSGRPLRHLDGDVLGFYLKDLSDSVSAIKHALLWNEDPTSYFRSSVDSLSQALSDMSLIPELSSRLNPRIDGELISREFTLEDVRNKIRGMPRQLQAVAWLMHINGTEKYKGVIHKMPFHYEVVYGLFGGVLERRRKVQNPSWVYLWLRDHMDAEEAIRYLSSPYPAVRNLASRRLEKGDSV